jgi:hypothetical protein
MWYAALQINTAAVVNIHNLPGCYQLGEPLDVHRGACADGPASNAVAFNESINSQLVSLAGPICVRTPNI